MITYEEQLNRNVDWALREGSMHFEKDSAVHKTLRTIAGKLDELGIPYALLGGMAMFLHGFRRFTEVVDILVTQQGLERIHAELEGLGYVRPFEGSKNLRDTKTGVRIEFLIAGQFPGDGKPKAVSFPDPKKVAVEIDGIRCTGLDKLIELKIVSGTTANRRFDLGDVQRLIQTLDLPLELANQLDATVRDMYRQLWQEIRSAPDQSEQ